MLISHSSFLLLVKGEHTVAIYARRTLPPRCQPESLRGGKFALPCKLVCVDNYMAPPSRLRLADLGLLRKLFAWQLYVIFFCFNELLCEIRTRSLRPRILLDVRGHG